MVAAWISKIKFNDGSELNFQRNDIVILVGPNNAGKSATLKELYTSTQHVSEKIILKGIEIQRHGDNTELIADLELKSSVIQKDRADPIYGGLGYSLSSLDARNSWDGYKKGLSKVHPFFVKWVNTEARITAANPPENISITKQNPQHPIHFLQADDLVEEKFSRYFKQAFGLDLILHRNAGNKVPLYVGTKPELGPNEDRTSHGYITRLEQLDELNQQGDGMRAFVGVLLNAFILNHSILLIDEPEAFLHPPQARLLGKMIGKELPANRQLFLATHDENFLKGLLDSGNENIKVIRINREGNINTINELHAEDINTIWNDSLLRHSNILGGLFHSKVVLCESDSDCRFYSAILSSIFDDTEEVSPDILFVHCGGKHRMPIVINALKKLGVPIQVIVDFDILNDQYPIKEIFTDLNGIWEEIENDWKIVKSAVDSKKPELEKVDLKENIDLILEKNKNRIIEKETISSISMLLKRASPWSYAKEIGKTFLPAGDQTKAFERLNAKAIEVGLNIVEVGELESFVKSIGNHGPKWVNEVLKMDLKNNPDLNDARSFVKRIV